LGLILLELSVNISTIHEKLFNFSLVKDKRAVPGELRGKIEEKMILMMTEQDPMKRPKA
jgi:hypothetical protein